MTYPAEYHPARDFDAIAASDTRLDAAEDKRLAKLRAQGYTNSQCPRCRAVRVLDWAGGFCNEYDAHGENEMCGGTYQAVKALTLSNPVTGAAHLCFTTDGSRL